MVRMGGSGPERGRQTASRHFARVGYPRTAAARRRPYGVRPSRASLKLVVDQLALEGAVLDRPPVADPVLHLGAVPGLERGLAGRASRPRWRTLQALSRRSQGR